MIVDRYPQKDTHPWMLDAWLDCLMWAASEPAILAAFSSETGIECSAPASTLDRMIDEASGRNASAAIAFVDWFNANVWGDVETDEEEESVINLSLDINQ